MVNKNSRTVDMLGIKYYSVEKSYTFGKSSGSYGYKHPALSGTKIFVSDLYAGGSQPQSFLKAIDLSSSKVDSIGVTSSGYIYGLLPAAGKIFVSTFELGSGRMHVSDPSNYSKLTTINLLAVGFYPVGSKDFVYCISANNLVKINTTSFATTQIPLDAGFLGLTRPVPLAAVLWQSTRTTTCYTTWQPRRHLLLRPTCLRRST